MNSDHGFCLYLVPMGGPWFFRLRRQTYSPRVPVVGTAASTAWSRGRVDRRACLARCRSVGFRASPARGGRT